MTNPTAITDHGETEETFNPRSVPAFPVINVRLTRGPDGVEAEVDGSTVPVDQNNAIGSVMVHAQDIAAQRPMRAVRVTATDVDENTWPMVVHADGRTWDLDTTPETVQRGISRRLVAGLTAGTLALAGAGLGGAWWLASRQDTPPPPVPTAAPAGESPVVPVTGWARRAAWVSAPIAPASSGPPVIATTDTVVTVLDDGPAAKLAALRPSDGATLWTTPIDGRPTTAPQLVSYGGREGIALATRDSLTIWPNTTSTPQPTRWEFTEASLRLVPTSPVPLLANTETHTALVLRGDTLEKRVLPAEAQPLTADENGTVLAADANGKWWSLTNETTAPSPKSLQSPTKGATPVGVLGMAGQTLLYAWEKGDQTLLAGYATEDGMKPAWDTALTAKADPKDLHVAADGSWAIVGTSALDPETGTVRQLPDDWKTTQITPDTAWSTAARGYRAPKMQAAQDLQLSTIDPAGIPVATAKPRGIIVAGTGQATRLYALEPDTGATYGPEVSPTEAATPTQKN